MMNRIMAGVTIFVLAFLAPACVVNKTTSEASGTPQPGILRTVAETALSWKGTALAGTIGAFGWVRGRRWKKAFQATSDAVEMHDDEQLRQRCAHMHAEAGVYDLARKHVRKYPRRKNR